MPVRYVFTKMLELVSPEGHMTRAPAEEENETRLAGFTLVTYRYPHQEWWTLNSEDDDGWLGPFGSLDEAEAHWANQGVDPVSGWPISASANTI